MGLFIEKSIVLFYSGSVQVLAAQAAHAAAEARDGAH
jgi:hypothetical protein